MAGRDSEEVASATREPYFNQVNLFTMAPYSELFNYQSSDWFKVSGSPQTHSQTDTHLHNTLYCEKIT